MSYELQFTPEQLALKPKFAAMLLEHPDNAFIAAQAVFPDDMARALYIASHWLTDPDVLTEKARLRDKGADLKTLPTKADLARRAWELTDKGLFEDRIKAMKLYADIMGHIEKPQAPVTNVNVTQNRVMVVKDKGTDAQWEEGVAKQQTQLLNESATRH